jgi:hypothetical protein
VLLLERARCLFRSLPLLARIGLAVLVFGGAVDVNAHALAAGQNSAAGHTAAEMAGHVIAFVGMVLVLAGVVVDGIRQTSLRRASDRRTPKGVA